MNKSIKKYINDEVKRYFIIAIKKLMTTPGNKEKLLDIELKQNEIRNKINNLKKDGLEYVEIVEELNKKFLNLELKKPQINWDQLVFKCCLKMKERHKDTSKEELMKIIEVNKKHFIKNSFSLESFRKYNNISRKKSYKKMKEEKGEIVMTTKERSEKIAAIKREKSLNLVLEVLDILEDKKIKKTSKNVYETIKNDFNDCLKERQIKTYLKQIKDSKNGL